MASEEFKVGNKNERQSETVSAGVTDSRRATNDGERTNPTTTTIASPVAKSPARWRPDMLLSSLKKSEKRSPLIGEENLKSAEDLLESSPQQLEKTKKDESNRAEKEQAKPVESKSKEADGPTEEAPKSGRANQPPPQATNPSDDENESPVKHISFSTSEAAATADDNDDDGDSKRSEAPSYLDETTLALMRSHVATVNPETILDDDDVTQFMIRMNRLASQQAQYHHFLVGESDESDTSLYDEILADEEEHAIGATLFRRILEGVKRQHPETEIVSKTVGWVKRAAGLHRTNAESQLRENAIRSGSAKPMRTRMTTRRSRVEKRDKALKTLATAAQEIENQILEVERKRPRSYLANEDERTSKRPRVAPDSTLHATIRWKKMLPNGDHQEASTVITLAGVLVNGRRVRPPAAPTSPTSTAAFDLDGGRTETVASPSNNRRRSARKEPPMYLRALEWRARQYGPQRQQQQQQQQPQQASLLPAGNNKQQQQSHEYVETLDSHASKVKDITIHDRYKSAGVTHRYPRWKTMTSADSAKMLDPPRQRHKDNIYSAYCSRLMAAMGGKFRHWAFCEFFYSDLDREWYCKHDFLQKALQLGIQGLGPHTMLTRRQWAAIRRRISKKPRRFSAKFIAFQRSERNKYRNTVRMLQRNPVHAPSVEVSFDVPAIIRAGTIVTALSRRFRMVQRGTVLSYDKYRARYLVLFENRAYGTEYCPDSEVATHGGPQLLIRRSHRLLNPSLAQDSAGLGSVGTAKLLEDVRKPSVAPVETFRRATEFQPLAVTTRGKNENKEKGTENQVTAQGVAEQEALVTVLSVLETATARKESLIKAMEQANAGMGVHDLPFGDTDLAESADAKVSIQFGHHYGWIRANLEETNGTIDDALSKLRLLYGKAYFPVRSTLVPARHRLLESMLPDLRGDCRHANDELGLGWMQRATGGTTRIARSMIASLDADHGKGAKNGQGSALVNNKLETACKSLLTLSCARFSRHAGPVPAAAATGFVESEVSALATQIPNSLPLTGLLADVQIARSQALTSLQEAFALLQAELAVPSCTDGAMQRTIA